MELSKSYFFSIDDKHLSEAVLFHYLGVKINDNYASTLSNTVPFNPVYLLFEDDEIVFYFHGLFGPEKEHVNIPFFRFSLFGRRRLEQTLTEELLDACDDFYVIENDIYKPDKCKDPVYSNRYFSDDENVNLKEQDEKEDKLGLIIPHRRLLLDFMFDFENFNIFEASPGYERIHNLLHGNPTYMSILSKADYRFQRCRIKELSDKQESGYRDKLLLIRDYFLKSEEIWTDQIRKNEFESLCLKKRGWFEYDVEEEYKNVLEFKNRRELLESFSFKTEFKNFSDNLDRLCSKSDNSPGGPKDDQNKKMGFWGTLKDLFCNRQNKFDKKIEKLKGKYEKWAEAQNGTDQSKEMKKECEKIRKLNSEYNKENKREMDFLKKASDYYLGRYAIWRAFRVLLQFTNPRVEKIFMGSTVIVFVLEIIGMLIFLSSGIREYISHCIVIMLLIFLFFLIPALFLIGFLLLSLQYQLTLKLAGVLILRLQVVLIITWTSLVLSDKIWNLVFQDMFLRINCIWLFVIVAILLGPVWLFISSQLTGLAPSLNCPHWRALKFVGFSLFCSVLIGILFMSSLYEFRWEREDYMKNYKMGKDISLSDSISEGNFVPVLNSGSPSIYRFLTDTCTNVCPKDTCIRRNDTSIYKNDTFVCSNIDSNQVDTAAYMWQHFLFSLGFHLFPRFFVFGAILAVYLGVFVELGIGQRVVVSETALPD